MERRIMIFEDKLSDAEEKISFDRDTYETTVEPYARNGQAVVQVSKILGKGLNVDTEPIGGFFMDLDVDVEEICEKLLKVFNSLDIICKRIKEN